MKAERFRVLPDVVSLFLRINNNMVKNTEIKLVGQPILSQVLQLVDKNTFQHLVSREKK